MWGSFFESTISAITEGDEKTIALAYVITVSVAVPLGAFLLNRFQDLRDWLFSEDISNTLDSTYGVPTFIH